MDAIWNSIEWEWHDHPHPDKAAVALATEFLKATKAADFFPESASSGRFPTVRLFWQKGRVEIEVFPNSFELYFLPRVEEEKEYTISEFGAELLPRVVEEIKKAVSRTRS